MNQTERTWAIRELRGLKGNLKLLLYHINSRGEICIDSQRDIAEMTGISQPSVGRALKELESLGYINRGLLGSKMGFCLNDSLLCSIHSESKVIQSESIATESVIQSESKRFSVNQSDSERIKVIHTESPSKEEIKEENISINKRGRGRRVPPGYFDGLTDKQALERFKSPPTSDPIPFQERTTLEKKFFQLTGKYPLRPEVDALAELGYTPQLLERHFGESDPGPEYWHWKRKGFVWQRDKTPNQGMNKNILMDNAHTALKWKPVQATAPSGNSTQPYVEFF